MGTMLRVRRYYSDFDGNEGMWESWRIELLDSGMLVAGMITDTADFGGDSVSSYAEWLLPTENVWDWDNCFEECVDSEGVFDDQWLRMSSGGESVTMFPGDRCDVGEFRIWLESAYGHPCEEFGDVGADVLALNVEWE